MIERLVSKEYTAETRKTQVKGKVNRLLGEYCSRQYRIGTTDILVSAMLSPELFLRMTGRMTGSLKDYSEICFISTVGLRQFKTGEMHFDFGYGGVDVVTTHRLIKTIQRDSPFIRIELYYDSYDTVVLEKYGDHWYYLTPRVLEGGTTMDLFTEALGVGLTYDDVIQCLPNMPKGGRH